jgi:hypothetical protein
MGPRADLDRREEKHILPLQEIEPQFLGNLARNSDIIPTGKSPYVY